MKKLSKIQIEQRQNLSEKMTAAKEALEAAVETFNGTLGVVWEQVEEALDKLNEAIQEAEEFRMEVAQAQEEYYDERSEKWQEGEAGQAYQVWKDDWNTDLCVVEIEQPEDLEMQDVEAIDNFEMLNDEP